MARRDRDEEDDYGDDEFPSARKSGSGLMLALVLGGGLLVLLLVGVVVAMFFMRAAAVQHQEAARADMEATRMAVDRAEADPMQKMLTQKEFESLVMNRSRDKIIASVGRPDKITTRLGDREKKSPSIELWDFKGRVLDEATGRPHPIARVYMNQNESFRVEYP